MVTYSDSCPSPRTEDCVDQEGAPCLLVHMFYWRVITKFLLGSNSWGLMFDHTYWSLLLHLHVFQIMQHPLQFPTAHEQSCCGTGGVRNIQRWCVACYANTWEIRLSHICSLGEQLVAATLTLNRSKCKFGQVTVKYLGKVTGQGHVRPGLAKVLAKASFHLQWT